MFSVCFKIKKAIVNVYIGQKYIFTQENQSKNCFPLFFHWICARLRDSVQSPLERYYYHSTFYKNNPFISQWRANEISTSDWATTINNIKKYYCTGTFVHNKFLHKGVFVLLSNSDKIYCLDVPVPVFQIYISSFIFVSVFLCLCLNRFFPF